MAYNSIVAAGANATCCYRADAAPVRPGELVLIDAGCELDGYASDITHLSRRWQVHRPAARALPDWCWPASKPPCRHARGRRFNDPHEATVAVLAQGLLDLGLLDSNKVGSAQDVIASKAYSAFYMHRTGHWLGLDVHDCGSYIEPSEADHTTERQDPLTTARA
ncbi:MAG: M24 family metallopeptidase [Paenacidovorax caeni]